MADTPNDPQTRFLQRVERRARFLKTLQDCGLAVFLPADEQQRKRSIEQVARATARQSELAQLTATTLASAVEIFRTHFEAMQPSLPHDVQYRNRIKRNW